MRKIILIMNIMLFFFIATVNSQNTKKDVAAVKGKEYPRPTKTQLAWQEAELGVVYHYDLHVFGGENKRQINNRTIPMPNYQLFNPEQIDTDQWVKTAKDFGAKFAILTATHETGFALFQSRVNPYSMRALDYKDGKGDIVADFVASCRKYGIKPGIYIGIRWNSFMGVHDFKASGTGDVQEYRQKAYNTMIEGMVKEICTNYGDLFEIWFDGGADHPDNGAPDVLPIVQKYQPNCLFYHNKQLAEARWGGSESGTVGYPSWATFPYESTGTGESDKNDISKNGYRLLKQGDPNGAFWMPAMADAPLRGYNGGHKWFYEEPGQEKYIYPLDNLMDMYYKSVGRNATLIVGLTPDDKGLMPDADVQRMKEWGDEISKRFSKPLANTSGTGKKITLNFDQPSLVNHIIIQEDIRYGESIRNYQVEGFVSGKWKILAKGESVGNKRIERFKNVKVKQIRLIVISASREVNIKNLSAYFVLD